ncbi:MAG: hypothetical protein R2759_17120 [Bacteroidales bacterium]
MEGGDTWYYDTQTAVHSMFGVNATADGGSDLSTSEWSVRNLYPSVCHSVTVAIITGLIIIASGISYFDFPKSPSPSYGTGLPMMLEPIKPSQHPMSLVD